MSGRIDELPERDPGIPRFVWLALILALGLGAWALLRPERAGEALLSPAPSQDASLPDSEAAALGARLFVAQGCGGCHPTVGPDSSLGPSLETIASRASARLVAPDYAGTARDVASYVAEASLDHCRDRLPGYDCPELTELSLRLSLADGEALAAFLLRDADEEDR